MDRYAVIVAGGSGSRMQSKMPKQFLELAGKPILIHTLERFNRQSIPIKIILVLPASEIPTWEGLLERHKSNINHKVVAGGPTRYDSVQNGLSNVPNDVLVAIHDGVRPFTSSALITQCYEAAEEHGSGVAAVVSKDSIREIRDNINQNVDRAAYRLMQTPQTFQSSLIKNAFLNYTEESATDDATIAEKEGHRIRLIEGEYTNLKITTPEDIAIAQALIDNKLVPN